MAIETQLLVVGAGPFGLALAASAKDEGVDCVVAGRAMSFWQDHMPRGMYLRSGRDWYLDPAGVHTIDAFLAERGIAAADATPLPRALYLEYVDWFRRARGIEPLPIHVTRLDRVTAGGARFRAAGSEGETIDAASVALAVGFQYFRHTPPSLTARIPPARLVHTCDLADVAPLRGQRVLIVGGRQSAFESAALLLEAGAASVDLVYRHDTPRFTESDWSWVPAVVARFADDPGWYRRISQEERDGYNRRLWEEGRLKLEPWLTPRLASPALRLWPRAEIARAVDRPDALNVTLTSGTSLDVDAVVLATGYKVDLSQIPFLAAGNLLGDVATRNGFPVLDDRLQTNVPGLFVTSLAATQDFGSFFGFTVSARTAAQLIAGTVAGRGLTR